jgi:hypothetical protein
MYSIVTPTSVTAIIRGVPYTVASDHERFAELITAIDNDDNDAAFKIVNAAEEVSKILACFGDVTVFGGHVMWKGETIHNYLVDRLLSTVRSNGNAKPLGRFLERVLENPSRRAVQDLYSWCEKAKMPLTPDGCIIAYKIVNHDFTDCYSGKFDNTPGKVIEVPRNRVDEDPDRTCSYGLHFCSAEYLPAYGPSNKKVVLVKVSPADVVAFPRDYNLSKARCCKYEVLEEIDAATAATFFKDHQGDYYGSEFKVGDLVEACDGTTGVITEIGDYIVVNGDYWNEEDMFLIDDDDRIERIEDQLGLPNTGSLDAINEALGFEPGTSIDRAESQLGLS